MKTIALRVATIRNTIVSTGCTLDLGMNIRQGELGVGIARVDRMNSPGEELAVGLGLANFDRMNSRQGGVFVGLAGVGMTDIQQEGSLVAL